MGTLSAPSLLDLLPDEDAPALLPWLWCSDPSGIRIGAKQRETTREVAFSVRDARSEIGEKSRRYVER
jgi:hypothetical protein